MTTYKIVSYFNSITAYPCTNHERANLVLAYGLAEGNASTAQHLYRDKYPKFLECLDLHATTLSMIYAWGCEKGSITRDDHAGGRSTPMRTPALEEALIWRNRSLYS